MIIMIFGLIATLICTFFIYKFGNKKNGKKKLLFRIIAFLIVAFGLELSVFNCNFYSSLNNKPVSLNSYLNEYTNINGVYELTAENNCLTVNSLNKKISNIYIDIIDNRYGNTGVTVYLTDEGNSSYFGVPVRTVNPETEKSKFINIHTAGETKSLEISFDVSEKETVKLNGISINEKRNFEFSPVRIIIVLLVCLFFELFKPSSFLYKVKAAENKVFRHQCLVFFIYFQCIVFIVLSFINPTFTGIALNGYNTGKWDGKGIDAVPLSMQNHNQYDELAQAFLKGKTYIDNNDIPEFLKKTDNPYDTVNRAMLGELYGEEARWDVAYFNGHYYVYFGIVPLLLMYLPFRAVFNAPFPTSAGICIFAFLFTIGVYLLLMQLVKDKFKNTSVGVFFLTLFAFVNCCGLIFLVKRPDFYSIPIITGMTFSVYGIYFWFKALSSRENRKYLFWGSLFMALVAGCRPQLVLLSFVAIPLFFTYFLKDKYFIKKDGIKDITAFAVPFIAIALGIMYYNFIRFGSPFDFGSSYNLTTNDVTKRGIDIGRTGLGIFTYLFQTPVFTAVFPFLKKAEIATNYAGRTIYENCFGGLITCTPVLWFLFLFKSAKQTLKENKLFLFSVFTVLTGLFLVIADTQAGGLLQRYYSDFGFVFFLAAAIIIFALFANENDKMYNNLSKTLLIISTFFSFFYVVCLAFSVSDVTIDTQNPTLFTYLSETVQFWL